MIEVKYENTEEIIANKIKCKILNLQSGDMIQIVTTIKDENNQIWKSIYSSHADNQEFDFTIDEILRNINFEGIEKQHFFDNPGYRIFERLSKKKISTGNYTPKFMKLSDNDLILDITVKINNENVDSKALRYKLKNDSISTMTIKENFVGKYFYKENEKQPAVIVLGGSMGDLKWSEQYASLLSNMGYNTLALSYFSFKGSNHLPRQLTGIDLEYFKEAADWLRSRKENTGDKIGIIGLSKGAELALILGTQYTDRIKTIIAISPSSYCFEGVYLGKNKGLGSWKLKNEELSFLQYPEKTKFSLFLEPGYLYQIHKKAIENATNLESARIKVENIIAPALLVSGGNDLTWPSSEMCKNMISNNNSLHWINYKDAGHIFTIPNIPPLLESKKQNQELCYNANNDLWCRITSFLQQHMKEI